uniref:Uncharacterized protein n=1 Tax=Oryza rufipogon TaxID=4529 RepID=A0A0E0NA14_ORYRU
MAAVTFGKATTTWRGGLNSVAAAVPIHGFTSLSPLPDSATTGAEGDERRPEEEINNKGQ